LFGYDDIPKRRAAIRMRLNESSPREVAKTERDRHMAPMPILIAIAGPARAFDASIELARSAPGGCAASRCNPTGQQETPSRKAQSRGSRAAAVICVT
jgi:hypothetical protein